MLQLCRDLNLTQESFGGERLRELRAQYLERHPPPVLAVLGEIDRGHSALAKLSHDAIPLFERMPLRIELSRHGGTITQARELSVTCA